MDALLLSVEPSVEPSVEGSWRDSALCAQTDPDIWFPEKGQSSVPAQRICLRCPVRTPCLEYATAIDPRFGIWGGLSERERRRVRRAAAEEAA